MSDTTNHLVRRAQFSTDEDIEALRVRITDRIKSADFKSRSAAEIRRDASPNMDRIFVKCNEATPQDESPEHPGFREVTLATLSDEQVEGNYAIAKHYATCAAEMALDFCQSLELAHQRCNSAEAMELANDCDIGEPFARERVLALMLTAGDGVFDILNSMFSWCTESLIRIDEAWYRCERMLIELDLYTRDLPHLVDRAKLHWDIPMSDLGFTVFREAPGQ